MTFIVVTLYGEPFDQWAQTRPRVRRKSASCT
jgi:hypothetical protein